MLYLEDLRDNIFSFSHYSPNEYVLLTNGGEHEGYEEAIENEHKDQ